MKTKIREYKYTLNGKVPEACSDVLRWGQWLEDNMHKRHVGDTMVAGVIRVSTVFLGIDYDFSGVGPPRVFETMCFAAEDFGAEENLPFQRYSTWEQAEKGHHLACEACLKIAEKAGVISKSQLKRIAAIKGKK